jgi:hypothetical protein
MSGPHRRRRRIRREQNRPADEPVRSPSPFDLAELGSPFALTATVHDPEPDPVDAARAADDPQTERGLRGLVGGGSSQVSVTAALRARDAARPTEADLARADSELVIVKRGWVPREDLPRGPRR